MCRARVQNDMWSQTHRMSLSWCPQTWSSASCSLTTTRASPEQACPTLPTPLIPPAKRAPPSTPSRPPTGRTAAVRPGRPATNRKKKWFTDEPENAYPRNIQIKPMSTHMANQVNQYKSTSSLIPPIREVEDECWTPGFLADSPDICALFLKRWGRHHHWRNDDDDDDDENDDNDDGGVEDWHISLHSFF